MLTSLLTNVMIKSSHINRPIRTIKPIQRDNVIKKNTQTKNGAPICQQIFSKYKKNMINYPHSAAGSIVLKEISTLTNPFVQLLTAQLLQISREQRPL